MLKIFKNLTIACIALVPLTTSCGSPPTFPPTFEDAETTPEIQIKENSSEKNHKNDENEKHETTTIQTSDEQPKDPNVPDKNTSRILPTDSPLTIEVPSEVSKEESLYEYIYVTNASTSKKPATAKPYFQIELSNPKPHNSSTNTPRQDSIATNTPELDDKTHAYSQSPEYNLALKNSTQCKVTYPNLKSVAVPILRKVMSLQADEVSDYAAHDVVRGSQTMLRNMMSSDTHPIHPLAFFATIKHFESSSRTQNWGFWDFDFHSKHCTSGICSGYFQVDVHLERDWSLEEVCGQNGLDILGLKGAPDFCSMLFWWTKAAGNTKCLHMQNYGSNPCLNENYTWNYNTFAFGHKQYGQANRWAKYGIQKPWKVAYLGGMVAGEYFTGYESCATAHYQRSPAPKKRIVKVVREFSQTIGL